MDLDGDGILDIVSGQYVPGFVFFFKGLGEGRYAKRQRIEEDWHGDNEKERDMKYAMSTANFADWDGDGDYDMIVGNVKGAIFLSENVGDRNEFRFAPRKPMMIGDQALRVVQKSDPHPVDWNGDGRLDLLVGDEAGDVTYFEGTDDGSFQPGVSLLTGLSWESLSYAKARARLEEAKSPIPGYRLRVETADWNGDGRLDLILGNCVTEEGQTTGHVYVMLRKASAS